jgi:hypothetical protein
MSRVRRLTPPWLCQGFLQYHTPFHTQQNVIGDIRTKGGLGPVYCIRGLSFLGGSQFNKEREQVRRISGRIIGVQEGMRTAKPARTPPKNSWAGLCWAHTSSSLRRGDGVRPSYCRKVMRFQFDGQALGPGIAIETYRALHCAHMNPVG